MVVSLRSRNLKTTATRARQGRLGRPVLIVLLVSTTLAFLAMVAAWMGYNDRMNAVEPNNARQPADARAFDQPPLAPKSEGSLTGR